MSSSTEVARCIAHLHRTELHGQQISVEKVGLIILKLFQKIDHLMQESVLTYLLLEKKIGERRSLQKGVEEGK